MSMHSNVAQTISRAHPLKTLFSAHDAGAQRVGDQLPVPVVPVVKFDNRVNRPGAGRLEFKYIRICIYTQRLQPVSD